MKPFSASLVILWVVVGLPEARKRDDHALLTALEEFLVDHCGGEERFEHDPRS
jgi:hypothetical protein